MKDFKETLIELDACEPAIIWAGDKDFKTVYETCERGDWLLWLYARTNKYDVKGLTLAKAHCANTVRYLMNDKRSTDAIDVAILFGEGKATLGQLNVASSDASFAAPAATYAAASAAAYAASYAATYAAYAAIYAANARLIRRLRRRIRRRICRIRRRRKNTKPTINRRYMPQIFTY